MPPVSKALKSSVVASKQLLPKYSVLLKTSILAHVIVKQMSETEKRTNDILEPNLGQFDNVRPTSLNHIHGTTV